MGIHVGHQPSFCPNRVGEVLSIRIDIFATEKDMIRLNMAMMARTVYLVEKVLHAVRGIFDRKWFADDLSVSIFKNGQ